MVCSRRTYMDARRYDRNADQLAQILWHYTGLKKNLPTDHNEDAHRRIDRMLDLISEALRLNDNMGQMEQKGLI